MTKEEMPIDFWNYDINPISGLVVSTSGRRSISDEDIRTRRYSTHPVVKRE